MRKINFLGFGSYLPNKVLTNFDLEKLVDTSDEWIVRRTGIKTRHIVDGEDVSDLAFNASLKCLSSVPDFSVEEIDAIVVATCTAEKRIPAVANILQNKLGIKRQILSFDINAACSGFLYGLSIVSSMVAAGKVYKVLLVGVDAMSTIVDWKDRNTCILFGDGAGATLISVGSTGGLIYDSMSCDASLCNALYTDVKGKLQMDGRKVFEAAVKKLTTEINKAFDAIGMSINGIDYFVMHQANIRIIDLVSEKIGIDPSKVIVTVDKCANTSAASIPITLDYLNSEKVLKRGDKLLVTAMGGGFTYGVMIVEY